MRETFLETFLTIVKYDAYFVHVEDLTDYLAHVGKLMFRNNKTVGKQTKRNIGWGDI